MDVLNECLASYGGFNWENVQRLQRYKDWSSTYEEFPCFTKCYLNRMWNIYDEFQGFIKDNVVKVFGEAVYDKCEALLRLSSQSDINPNSDDTTESLDKCATVYRGFHCLVKVTENDELMIIT